MPHFQSAVGVSVIGQLTNNCILCLNKLPAFSVGPVKSDIVLTYDGQLKDSQTAICFSFCEKKEFWFDILPSFIQ